MNSCQVLQTIADNRPDDLLLLSLNFWSIRPQDSLPTSWQMLNFFLSLTLFRTFMDRLSGRSEGTFCSWCGLNQAKTSSRLCGGLKLGWARESEARDCQHLAGCKLLSKVKELKYLWVLFVIDLQNGRYLQWSLVMKLTIYQLIYEPSPDEIPLKCGWSHPQGEGGKLSPLGEEIARING